MNVTETVAIAVRLFAAWVAVYLVQSIPSLVLAFEADELKQTHAAVIGAIALGFLVVLLLWKFPLTVARSIIPNVEIASASTGTTERDFCRAGFIVLGFYLLTQSIADGLYLGMHFLAKTRNPMSSVVFEFEQKAQVVATIVEAIMATALTVGSQRLRDWAYRVRNG